MILNEVFERFLTESPVSVMARALFENALPPADLDALFEEKAQRQYTRELLFSQVVDVMSLVVCNSQPTLSAAIRKRAASLPVSRKAVYAKIDNLEPALGAALVQFTAGRLTAVLAALGPPAAQPVAGCRLRVIDGNHLPASEHRLKPLRFTRAGALPGQSLVAFDPVGGLVTDVVCCECGHAQERSLTPAFLALVAPNDLWVADRNFCTTPLLTGVAARGAHFVIRQHALVQPDAVLAPDGDLLECGRCDTGALSERYVDLSDGDAQKWRLRRVTLRLDAPTRDGDGEMHILTDLPRDQASAAQVAELYRGRWKIEAAFGELEAALHSEVRALGYPKAALFAFCVALVAFNVLAALKAAIRAAHGPTAPEMSGYYLALEVGTASRGLLIAVPVPLWVPFQRLSPEQMAAWLVATAKRIRLAEFAKTKRGPKKPRPPRTSGAKVKHLSTKKVLDEIKKK